MADDSLCMRVRRLKLPRRIIDQLRRLIDFAREITNGIFSVKGVMLLGVLSFIGTRPFLVTNTNVNIMVKSTVTNLVATVPFLNPVLTPVTTVLKVAVATVKTMIKRELSGRFRNMNRSVIRVTRRFFSLLTGIVGVVFQSIIATWSQGVGVRVGEVRRYLKRTDLRGDG